MFIPCFLGQKLLVHDTSRNTLERGYLTHIMYVMVTVGCGISHKDT